MRRNHGFSLIEVLLALAVGGIVLMAASSLLVTISQAWANRPATRDAFDAHVNGVAHFLTAMLEEATNPKDGSKGNEAIELARPVGFSDREDPLIKFHLHEAPPLFYWPHGLANRAHTYFQFEEGEGFFLLWYSELQELEKSESGELQLEDEDEIFRTLISPYFDEVYYCYYGSEDDSEDDQPEWQIESSLEENVESGSLEFQILSKLFLAGRKKTLREPSPLQSRNRLPVA
jgi:prepilin-type N-terminal cleavage/methylation domain-containing protein